MKLSLIACSLLMAACSVESATLPGNDSGPDVVRTTADAGVTDSAVSVVDDADAAVTVDASDDAAVNPLTLTAVAPLDVVVTGGVTLTLSGTGFLHIQDVSVFGAGIAFARIDDSTLTVVAPDLSGAGLTLPAQVEVRVTRLNAKPVWINVTYQAVVP